MKYKTLISIFLIITILLTGCWDSRELKNMLIVSGIALDKGEKHNVKLTLMAPLAKGSPNENQAKSAQRETFLISDEGEDIMDAYRKISFKLSRQIFLAQAQIIVIGEDLAKEGVSGLLDFFPRHSEAPVKIFVMFTKGEAAKILKTESPLEASIVDEIKAIKELNFGKKMQLKDFFYEMTEEGIHPIAPLFQRTEITPGSKDNNIKLAAITGAAVFKKDKLIGWINSSQYRGVLWIQNKIKSGGITVNIPKDYGGGKVSGQIKKAKSKIVPIVKDNEIEIQVLLSGEVNVTQSDSKLDFGKPETIKLMEKLYSEEVKNYAKNSVDLLKGDFNSDVFGFGAVVHGKYPKLWEKKFKKSWDDDFYKLNVKISSNIKIYEVGFDTKSSTKSDPEFLQ